MVSAFSRTFSTTGIGRRGCAPQGGITHCESKMHTVALSDSFAVHPAVVFRELSGGAVLLNLTSGVYYGLDSVGTRVWSLLTQDQPMSAICATLLDEFDVAPDVLERDVLKLVSELCEKSLITPRAHHSPTALDR